MPNILIVNKNLYVTLISKQIKMKLKSLTPIDLHTFLLLHPQCIPLTPKNSGQLFNNIC